jgi:hypothetical protein
VAVTVAVPAEAGVNTPVLLTVPAVVGLTDQVTAVLKLPVPVTLALQVDVCEVRIDVSAQVTVTDVMEVEVLFTVTVAEPDLVVS